MAISSYGAVSCLSVVEGSAIRLFFYSKGLFHDGFDSAQPPDSASSAFIYIISRRSRGFTQIVFSLGLWHTVAHRTSNRTLSTFLLQQGLFLSTRFLSVSLCAQEGPCVEQCTIVGYIAMAIFFTPRGVLCPAAAGNMQKETPAGTETLVVGLWATGQGKRGGSVKIITEK
jgi:hypothetical protein